MEFTVVFVKTVECCAEVKITADTMQAARELAKGISEDDLDWFDDDVDIKIDGIYCRGNCLMCQNRDCRNWRWNGNDLQKGE